MATAPKKPAAKKPSTAVAKVARAQVALPEDIAEKMAADVAAFQGRMAAPASRAIGVTQDRKFLKPGSNKKDKKEAKFDVMHGVIVDFVARNRWYQNAFDPEEVVPPNCFAIDFAPHNALVPSENSPDVQNSDCLSCPKNQFKSAANGKAKACKNEYVLAIMSPDGEGPLMTLTLSATALKPFDKYVRDLARDFGAAPYGFITEFYMADDSDYPSVRCGSPEDIRTSPLFALAYSRREEAAALLSVEPDVSEWAEKVGPKATSLKGPKKTAARR